MNQVDQIVEKALLFDFYGELLTNHQKEVYEEHVLNDLSVTEIAELLGISRQGVHDLIRRCDKILRDYENKLHLVEQFVRIEKMVETIHAGAMEMMDQDDPNLIRNNIRLIAETSEKLLEEF